MSHTESSDSGPAEPAVLNRKAIYSVGCGVVAFALIYASPILGLLVALPSLTSGVHARAEITASKGAQSGDSLAVIGLMIGGGAAVTVALSWLLPVVAGR